MKILYCVNHFFPSIGGSQEVSRKVIDFLRVNHDVHVFTRKIKNRDKSSYSFFEYSPGDSKAFDFALTKIKPDIVFVYSDVFDFFRNIVATKNRTYRLIVSLCGANWIYAHKNMANIFARNLGPLDKIIVHSKTDRDFKLCSSPELSKKLHIIPNGIDLAEFDSNHLSREDLHSDICGKIWLLNISNFFPGKGQEHIIPILNAMPNKEKLIYIQVCSDIEFPIGQQLENHWKKQCSTQLHKDIQWKLIKNPTRQQVIAYLKNSNVFCFTSEKEVAPLVILESMAAQLPWVSTDVGNVKELSGGKCLSAVKDPKFHSYFDERIRRLYVEAIQNLIQAPCIAEDGRRQIEETLNWDKILPHYGEIIN